MARGAAAPTASHRASMTRVTISLLLLRASAGIASATGAAQLLGSDGTARASSSVTAAILLACAAAVASSGLNSAHSAFSMMRNPDAPLARTLAACALFMGLLVAQDFALLVWSPGRTVDVLLGGQMLLVPLVAAFSSAFIPTRPGGDLNAGNRAGIREVMASISMGSVLYGTVAAVSGLEGGETALAAVLALGTISGSLGLLLALTGRATSGDGDGSPAAWIRGAGFRQAALAVAELLPAPLMLLQAVIWGGSPELAYCVAAFVVAGASAAGISEARFASSDAHAKA